MLKKTEGIVLSSIRYKDTSIIVRIFTRELGLKSYIVNGVRSQGAKSKAAIYQPMTILDLVVYEKEKGGLQRISEAKIGFPYQLIPFDFSRSGITMFMAEVAGKSLYDNYQNEWLFDFLKESLIHLDQKSTELKHFPLAFLVHKARFLGFGPDQPEEFFEESRSLPFKAEEIPIIKEYIENLLSDSYSCNFRPEIHLRRQLLDYFLDFYREQLDSVTPWKSIGILRQLMN